MLQIGGNGKWLAILFLAVFSTGAQSDETLDRDSWRVQIIAETERLRDDDNFLGQVPSASDGLDRFDREEARPYSRDYLSVLFNNFRLPKSEWGFSSDYRAVTARPEDQWHFTVKASAGPEIITLRWEGYKRHLDDGWLLDLETGVYINTVPGGRYSYPAGTEDRKFIFAIFRR